MIHQNDELDENSTFFVFIVSQFPAVLGVLQDFEKKSFANMRVKKNFWSQIAKKGISHRNNYNLRKIGRTLLKINLYGEIKYKKSNL